MHRPRGSRPAPSRTSIPRASAAAAPASRRAASALGERLAAPGGQGSVELLAVLPLAAMVALTAAQVLAAGLSAELAAHAAEAGAIAIAAGQDPRAAVRESLPGWSRDRVTIRVSGRAVRVRLPPPTFVPRLAGALTASADADAGPTP